MNTFFDLDLYNISAMVFAGNYYSLDAVRLSQEELVLIAHYTRAKKQASLEESRLKKEIQKMSAVLDFSSPRTDRKAISFSGSYLLDLKWDRSNGAFFDPEGNEVKFLMEVDYSGFEDRVKAAAAMEYLSDKPESMTWAEAYDAVTFNGEYASRYEEYVDTFDDIQACDSEYLESLGILVWTQVESLPLGELGSCMGDLFGSLSTLFD